MDVQIPTVEVHAKRNLSNSGFDLRVDITKQTSSHLHPTKKGHTDQQKKYSMFNMYWYLTCVLHGDVSGKIKKESRKWCPYSQILLTGKHTPAKECKVDNCGRDLGPMFITMRTVFRILILSSQLFWQPLCLTALLCHLKFLKELRDLLITTSMGISFS